MFKRTLLVAMVTAFSSVASAQQSEIDLAAENGIECFPLAHGVNGLGSQREVVIPPFSTAGTYTFEVKMVNTSSSHLNIRLKLFDENGVQLDSDYGVYAWGAFNETNNPFRKSDGLGVARLDSLNVGVVYVNNNNPEYYFGLLSWQANECITEPPLLAEGKTILVGNSGHISSGNVLINGGKPF